MTTTQIIAKQGWFGAGVLGVLFVFCAWWGAGLFTLLVFVALLAWLYAFRNPERLPLSSHTNAFCAPIDGIVRDISVADSKVRIAIETRAFDVGILRAPLEIVRASIAEVKGLALRASSKPSEILNARMSFRNLQGVRFEIECVPAILSSHGLFAAENLDCGERIGFMKMGMTYITIAQGEGDLELALRVNVGDKVRALDTAIGYFNEV